MREWLKKVCGSSKTPGGNKEQNRFFLASWAVLAFIGFFIPEDIITQHAWAREFTDFMARIVPQIDRVTALNLRPEVNRFHYSVLWVVSPVYFMVFMLAMSKNTNLGYLHPSKERIVGGFLLSIFVIGFSMFLWWGFDFVDPTDSLARLLFFASPFREIFAPILVYGFWFAVGMVILIPKGLLTGQLKILKKEEDTSDGKQ